jgi:hypothetical protein
LSINIEGGLEIGINLSINNQKVLFQALVSSKPGLLEMISRKVSIA